MNDFFISLGQKCFGEKMRPSLSVILVSYKAISPLRDCLSSLRLCLSKADQVIIVDNHSGPEIQNLMSEYPQFTWKILPENIGYAPAAHLGATLATGEHLLFLNPDTQIYPGSLDPLQDLLQDPSVGAVGPLSLFAAGWQNILYHLPEDRIFGRDKKGVEIMRLLRMVYTGKFKSVKLIVGFCLMIRRQTYLDIGGMDTDLILGMDDLDLSWRLREQGLDLRIALDAYVYHQGQQSFAEAVDFKNAWELQSQKALSQKLIQYYGSPSQVPSSWDLWEVNWFELYADSNTPGEVGQEMILTHELAVVLCMDSSKAYALPDTLSHLRELGIDQAQILILGDTLYQDYLGLRHHLGESLWSRIQDLFVNQSKVLFIREPQKPTMQAIRYLLNHTGALNLNSHKIQNTQEATIFALDLKGPWIHQLDSWTGPSAFHLETTNPSAETMILDLQNIRGLAEILKTKQEAGITLQLEFDNNLALNPAVNNPFSQQGLSFFDVERELNWAGYRVDQIEGLGILTENQSTGLAIRTDGRHEWENTLSHAPHLRLTATPLKSSYQLDLKVSFVILALNKVEYTKQCIESIQANCKQNYELILVNNGSTDGTADYFNSIPGAIVIHNPQNLGVSAGWNQGIRRATGDFVLIFNNDTLVPEGAIENLVRGALNFPKAGVIAPRSNAIAGPQLLPDFPQFTSQNELFNYLKSEQNKQALSYWQFPRIKGFCMLIPRAVIEQVGLFDEQFGFGNFEDDDYSLRLALAGYDLVVANDSIIFHYGSVSFDQAGINWNEQMLTNQKKFHDKWAKGRMSLSTTTQSSQSPDERLFALRMQLKKNSSDQAPLLEMAEICKTQMRLPEAFQHLCAALDYGPEVQILHCLEDLLQNRFSAEEQKSAVEYLQQRFSFFAPQEEKIQIFKNEDWIPQIHTLLESGQVEAAQRLLESLSSTQIQSFDALNFKGIIAYYQNDFATALEAFEQALRLQPTQEDCLVNFYDAGLRLRQFQRVLDGLERALAVEPNLEEVRRLYEELKSTPTLEAIDPEHLIYVRERNIQVEKLIHEGLWAKALEEAHLLLGDEPANFRALNNMGLIHWYQGEVEAAWNRFQRAVERNLLFVDAIVNLYDAAIVLDRMDSFMPYFERALAASPYQNELRELDHHIRMGTIPERLHHYFDQRQFEHIAKNKLLEGKSCLEIRDYHKAMSCYLQVIEADGDSAEAFNGLGLAAWYCSLFEDAFLAFKRASELRGSDGDTLQNLWDAAVACGRSAEAKIILENALLIDPGLTQIQAILDQIEEEF